MKVLEDQYQHKLDITKERGQRISIFKSIALKTHEYLKKAQENLYTKLNELQQKHNDLLKLSNQLEAQREEQKEVQEALGEIKKMGRKP